MTDRLIPLFIATLFIGGLTASAHHSTAALYDEAKQIQIEGRLVQFSFRSPHSFVAVEAPDEDGQMQRWAVGWNAARQLAAQGITRDFFKPGDHVVITGNPGRNPQDHIIRMESIFRESDGFEWGNRPDEVFD
jgi:hypothetical protein